LRCPVGGKIWPIEREPGEDYHPERETRVKRFRIVIIVVLLAAILVWIALGPGLRRFLETNGSMITSEVSRRTDDHVRIESLSGDYWSGIVIEGMIIYTDRDPAHRPLLEADRVVLHVPLSAIINREITASSVHISGFTVALHIDADGLIALPDWKISESPANGTKPLFAGWIPAQNRKGIDITCDNGVLEIYKKFPNLTETVKVNFTQLAGSGEFFEGEGARIDSITGDYLAAPLEITGWIPSDSDEPMELSLNLGEVGFSTVFRDIDPLFRGSRYLPTGAASLTLHFGGTREIPEIAGNVDLSETTVGNVKLNAAHADVAYSAGVVDLTNLTAEAYEGSIEGTGRVNLLAESPIWQADCTFEDIDLAEYLDQNGYYAYEVDGPFAGSAQASGDFASPASLQIDAQLTSDGGRYLSPFSDRFLNIASGQPNAGEPSEADLTTYDDVAIDVRVRESQILVDRLHFVSHDLQLEAHGWIGFDHTLSGSGGFTIPMDKARLHPRLRNLVTLLPSTIDRVALEFSISGELGNVRINPRIGENFLSGILDRVDDLYHDIGDAID
jgi:hypothetical protein